jgi:16S rRNA (cytosine967-C5)-methyltransferase
VRRWLARWGAEAAEAMLAAANDAPPLIARVNRLRLDRAEALRRLQALGVASEPLAAPSALRLQAAGDPAKLAGFTEGWLYYQDQSSQLVGFLADPPAGGLAVDWCSAPGGKATHLAELMDDKGQVLAYDRQRAKLARVRANVKRLGLHCITVLDQPPSAAPADRVLVDAPCSGLGTLRRHAEARWRTSEEDLPRLAAAQFALLAQAAASVKPGGHLIYSTCTTEPEENEDVVRAFLNGHPEFELRPGPGRDGQPGPELWSEDGFFRTFPNRLEGDGIFAARLVKRS